MSISEEKLRAVLATIADSQTPEQILLEMNARELFVESLEFGLMLGDEEISKPGYRRLAARECPQTSYDDGTTNFSLMFPALEVGYQLNQLAFFVGDTVTNAVPHEDPGSKDRFAGHVENAMWILPGMQLWSSARFDVTAALADYAAKEGAR